MNDYEAVKKHMENLSDDGFAKLLRGLGSEIVEVDGRAVEMLLDEPGGQRWLGHSWRKQVTEEMLYWKETDRAEWNRLCWQVRVETDQAASMRHSRDAIMIATASLLLSVINLLW
jgi:hypothetical protein